jgi:hypothetical protein
VFPVRTKAVMTKSKTAVLFFEPNSQLVFENLEFPSLIIYADRWSFNGYAEIRRTWKQKLDGADGDDAERPRPTRFGHGSPGNDGLPGLPGGAGLPGIAMPQVFIFAQEMYWNGKQATPAQVDATFFFDGYPGGNGGNGGNGSNGTDGNEGEPAKSGLFDCAAGPGWGGRGGNAGPGGHPGYGGNGGDATGMYMFVAGQQVAVFENRGGAAGRYGVWGAPGRPGRGGPEGKLAYHCGEAHRQGHNEVVSAPCPLPEIAIHAGFAAAPPTITDYSGFAELQKRER